METNNRGNITTEYDERTKTFYLDTKSSTYCIQVTGGDLIHLYWGKKIPHSDISYLERFIDRAFSPCNKKGWSPDTFCREYPTYGDGDYRRPAFSAKDSSGSSLFKLKYKDYNISKGKRHLEGLPYASANDYEATTLDIVLFDEISKLEVVLTYCAYDEYDIITRSVSCTNYGEKINIESIMSASLDFRFGDFDFMHFTGHWSNERNVERFPLRKGITSIESLRGTSSHQENPFFCICSLDATEDFGDVYAFNLIYSGSFLAEVQVDQFHKTRVNFGINPYNFSWVLEKGGKFTSPEAVLCYSQKGLGDMSRQLHSFYRNNLGNSKYKNQSRPILINNWEATYFDFNEENLLDIAKEGKKLGLDLFVLDDGWFGKRNSPDCSLGDWVANKDKLPNGLSGFAKKLSDIGMDFGIWLEPEMVSPDSDLYRKHPDWCLYIPNREKTLGRDQLVLNLTKKEVRNYLTETICSLLSESNISYVKWDMNRNITECYSDALPAEQQGEVFHRYILGLYEILEEITKKFPDVLFESCSGGGGRFDPGMHYYMPQGWTSDNTDAEARVKIQYGTSFAYPSSVMSCHISAVPNHQTERVTLLETRSVVAMSGVFGCELDLTKLTDDEKAQVKSVIEKYKQIRDTVLFGELYRIESPFDGNCAAWQYVSKDKNESVLFYYKRLTVSHSPYKMIKFKGLNSEYTYEVEGKIYSGDILMNVGLNVPDESGDFLAYMWEAKNLKSVLSC